MLVGSLNAQDAQAVLRAVAKNIGADNLTTLQISGAKGCSAAPGASYLPTDNWPRFEVTGYLRAIDFNARFLHEQIIRQYGPYPKLAVAKAAPRPREDR